MPSIAQVDLSHFLKILRRQRGLILGTVVLVTIATVIAVYQITPIFTAQATVMLETRKSKVVGIDAVLSGLTPDIATIRSELDVMRSRTLAGRAVDQLGLVNDPEFNSKLREDGIGAFLSAINPLNLLPADWRDAVAGGKTKEPASDEEKQSLTRARVIDAYLKQLGVINDGRSYIIRMTFDSSDAAKAARIVNKHADLYLVEQLEAKFEATRRATDWLNTRLDDLRGRVRESDRAVQQFRERNHLLEARGATVAAQQLSELNTQLTVERAERSQAEARLRRVQDLTRTPGGIETAAEVLASPLIQRLRE
ncbi:MAG: GumC family protein, partial [Rhodospirillales bacterium]|nr:GumC family protein [Rhodospirillales bacterium]